VHREKIYPVFWAALLAVACSNSTAPRESSAPVVGVWDWTEHFDDQGGVTCDDTGTYVFSLSGTGFAGRSDQVGTCAGASGTADNTSSDTVANGYVSGGRLTFTVGITGACQYGAAVPDSTDHLSGSATCGSATGTWSADRGLTVDSVAVTPAAPTVPENAAFPLVAVLRNTLGNRVFDRPATWSSDAPGVAAVDSQGFLNALLPGTAHIQLFSEGLTGVATVTVAGSLVTDSVGDASGAAPVIDIQALSAASDSTVLTVALRLADPLATTLYALLDLDVDQDSTTGALAQVDVFRADTTVSSGLGDEFVFDFSSGGLFDAVAGTLVATLPIYYDAATGTVTVRLPVALLGSARANVAMVVGNASGPTDLAPDEGHLTLDGPAPGPPQAGVRATPLRRFRLPWAGRAVPPPRRGKIR
jgi:Bacterial Ig-like domain (group 2)